MSVLDLFANYRIVPIVVLHKPENAGKLADALVAGGLPAAEIAFRTEGAEQIVRTLADRGDMLVGAGTVLNADQVDLAVDAGAQYVASPGLSIPVLERCAELGIPAVPGAATATDVLNALDLGFNIVKLFPAAAIGGVSGVKLLAEPFPTMQFIPAGGVGAAHIKDYLGLRSVLSVGGSWMVPGQALGRGDFKEVRDRTAHAVRLANSVPKRAK